VRLANLNGEPNMKSTGITTGILLLCLCVAPLTARAQVDPCPQREYGWTIATGAKGFDQARGVAIDADGNVYVGGMFEEKIDFDPGKDKHYHRAKEDYYDGFITSYDRNGFYRWS